ncbi:hypothetical protein HPK19_20895 [Arthrobacter citreus]|nr:hypothetical protein HPK19_20895 [Arthrobacter citreus]
MIDSVTLKKKKLIIVIASIFIVMVFSACDKNDSLEAVTSEQVSSEKISNLMKKESKELLMKNSSEFASNSKNFQIEAETYQSAKGRLELDIRVSKPKTYMKNVIISGILTKNAFDFLYTPDLLITNILIKDSFSNKEVSKQYTISPSIKSPGGISTGRSFNLFPEATFENASKKLHVVYMKVSWVDQKDRNHTEYIWKKIVIKHPEDFS